MTLDDLVTPMTPAQVRVSIYEVLSLVGVDTTTWKPGAVTRTMIAAVAILLSAMTTLTAFIARSAFLELSSGDWLTLVAHYVYNVTRRAATFAVGGVTLVNSGGGTYVITIGDLIVKNPVSGKTYRNTEGFTLNPSTTLPGVAIKAVEAGSASTTGPNTITAFETPLASVTVTNPASVVGADAEDDETLRARCSEKLESLSPNGPKDAYAAAARAATLADGTAVDVTRIRAQKDGFGNVFVYVADAIGALTSPELAAVDESIQTQAAPLSVTAIVANATPLVIPVTYEVWIYNTSGLTDLQLKDAIAAQLAKFFGREPIGGNNAGLGTGFTYRDAITSAIAATNAAIFHVIVTTPAGDTTVQASEVPTLGAITVTAVHQIAPGSI